MKKTVIILSVLALLVGGCGQNNNKQVSNIESMTEKAKEMPNTLSVIQAEEREIYLMEINRIPVETKMYPQDSWYGEARKHGEFVYVSFIEGSYPADYVEHSCILNIIIENKTIEFEVWSDFCGFFTNGKFVMDADPLSQWINVGYSTDNTLWAKIYEYYLENEDKSK
jgi:hypothetical protein